MTKAEKSAIYAAYADLEAAAEAFYNAIGTFQKAYNPDTVGLDELCEHINCTLVDVDAELDDVL